MNQDNMFFVPYNGWCKSAQKVRQSQRLAELTADKMALSEWQKGINASLHAYLCEHCGYWHVGHTKPEEKIEEGKVAIPTHRYKYLSAPMPKIPKSYFDKLRRNL